jgi:hypothetical protein
MLLRRHERQMLADDRRTAGMGVVSVSVVGEYYRCGASRAQQGARIHLCRSRSCLGRLEPGIRGIGASGHPQGAIYRALCVLEDDQTRMVQIGRWYSEGMTWGHHGHRMLADCCRTVALGAEVGVVEENHGLLALPDGRTTNAVLGMAGVKAVQHVHCRASRAH